MLQRWHMGPKKLAAGKYQYLDKEFKSLAALPNDVIDGQSIKTFTGRGWNRLGYSGMWTLEGGYLELTPYNEDPWVDEKEKTWGAAGMNSSTRHFVYEGGRGAKGAEDTRTPQQLLAMEIWVLDHISKFPKIKILGHNQVSSKECPAFNVPSWCREIGVSEENIYL